MDLPAAPPVLAVREGVRLRAFGDDDAGPVVAMAAEEAFTRWTSVPLGYGREDAEAFMRRVSAGWARGQDLTWALEVDGRLAGSVSLRPEADGGVGLGYGLAAAHRGRGVMSAALRTVLPWAAARGAAVVRWQAHVGNWPSRRVAWACGVAVEGTVRRRDDQRGELRDCWVGTWCPGDPTTPVQPWLEVPRVEVPLVTGDVVLRPWADEDATRVVEACTDPTTRRWLPSLPAPYGVEEASAYVESTRLAAAEGRAVGWCAADARSGAALASLQVFGLEGSRPAEIGYWAHPDARGRGVVTTAVRAAARHALLPTDVGGLGLPAVLVRAEPANVASVAVARRAGLAPAGWDLAPAGPSGAPGGGPGGGPGGCGSRPRPPVRLDRFLLTADDLATTPPS
ncbi:GNAT family N-acetyltransferase [Pseudokineococcus sp. 1T1Z-3]|uniref:GNAT family N-acetyltransferase n=1 Tax=Pseudokineococcus sp. 1T1Z-3 TaxID=3132745 RepID=UPI0030AF6581